MRICIKISRKHQIFFFFFLKCTSIQSAFLRLLFKITLVDSIMKSVNQITKQFKQIFILSKVILNCFPFFRGSCFAYQIPFPFTFLKLQVSVCETSQKMHAWDMVESFFNGDIFREKIQKFSREKLINNSKLKLRSHLKRYYDSFLKNVKLKQMSALTLNIKNTRINSR